MGKMQVAVAGAAGRMGQTLIRLIHASDEAELAGAIEAPGHPAIGRDAGEMVGVGRLGVCLTDDALPILVDAHGLIDFSTAEASTELATLSAQARIVHVMGSTGFSSEQEDRIESSARHATLIRAGNFSVGINLLVQLTAQVAERLGPDFDVEIVEMHHRHKVDAPSGTALMLGEAAARAKGVTLDAAAAAGRTGKTGPREKGRIGFASLRGGSVVGDHTVVFAGEGERIELIHRAEDRTIFARGALRAALWGWAGGNGNRGPGLYSMADVLGF